MLFTPSMGEGQRARADELPLLTIRGGESLASFEDKMLTCRDCGAEFVFTAGEQEFYSAKGLLNQPGRCPACRALNRTRRPAMGGLARGPASASFGPRPRRELFQAVCSRCGGRAMVPFAPRGDRPVYCSSCYEEVRQQVA